VAIKGRAPYKTILTHGFVLDAQQRKMSKSLGNVIEPSFIIEGGLVSIIVIILIPLPTDELFDEKLCVFAFSK
jgi:valyl-tRNA synthetase